MPVDEIVVGWDSERTSGIKLEDSVADAVLELQFKIRTIKYIRVNIEF